MKLAITAGIGSDHVDLEAAIKHGVTVAEVNYSNSISVSEHVVMMILSLVRNYLPSYEWVLKGGWNIADCVERSYDVEGMHVGTVAAGRIGCGIPRVHPSSFVTLLSVQETGLWYPTSRKKRARYGAPGVLLSGQSGSFS